MPPEQGPSAKMGRAVGLRWEDAEIALILGWRDYCNRYAVDYKTTIEQKLSEVTRMDGNVRANVSYQNIRRKLSGLLTAAGAAGSGKDIDKFLERDSDSLPKELLRKELVDEMNRMRKAWGLELLEQKSNRPPKSPGDAGVRAGAGAPQQDGTIALHNRPLEVGEGDDDERSMDIDAQKTQTGPSTLSLGGHKGKKRAWTEAIQPSSQVPLHSGGQKGKKRARTESSEPSSDQDAPSRQRGKKRARTESFQPSSDQDAPGRQKGKKRARTESFQPSSDQDVPGRQRSKKRTRTESFEPSSDQDAPGGQKGKKRARTDSFKSSSNRDAPSTQKGKKRALTGAVESSSQVALEPGRPNGKKRARTDSFKPSSNQNAYDGDQSKNNYSRRAQDLRLETTASPFVGTSITRRPPPKSSRAAASSSVAANAPQRVQTEQPMNFNEERSLGHGRESLPASQGAGQPATGIDRSSYDDLAQRIDVLSDIVLSFMGDQLAKYNVKVDESKNIEWNRRIRRCKEMLGNDPRSVPGKLIRELEGKEHALACARKLNRTFVTGQNFLGDPAERTVPSEINLDRKWTDARKNIRMATKSESDLKLMSTASAGYLAARIDDVFSGEKSILDLEDYVISAPEVLQDTHAVQAYLSAVLCEHVLMAPEPMCDGQHTPQTLAFYEQIKTTDGITTVQHHDQKTTHFLFADKDFRHHAFKFRSSKLSTAFEEAWKATAPHTKGLAWVHDPEVWFRRLIELKESLMLSPKEYRIFYVPPGTVFDSSWMKAEDAECYAVSDAHSMLKKVKVCLFPALAEQPSSALSPEAGIQDALVRNKCFFPSAEERASFDPVNIISKAVVFLE